MKDDDRFTRRRLLGGGAALAGVAALQPFAGARPAAASADGTACPPRRLLPPERIALHMYTVRDQIPGLGWGGVFERTADIGYAGVTFSAGYKGAQGSGRSLTAQQIRSLLDANGLRGVAAHTNATSVQALEPELDDAVTIGLEHIGVSSASSSANTVAGWQAAAENYNRLGAAAAARGLRFYIHNHATEFGFTADDRSKRIYDILLERTDPELVFFQMDIYWAHVGQHQYSGSPLPAVAGVQPPAVYPRFEPRDYVLAHPERFPTFHVKDGRRNAQNSNGYDIVDVGYGDLDFPHFFSALGGRLDQHWYFQEQDNAASAPHGSWASATRSFLWMRHGLLPVPEGGASA